MRPEYIIKGMEPDFIPAVSVIDREVFASTAYPRLFFRQAFDLYPGTCFVALASQIIVGYCLGASAANHNQGWILSIAVSEDYRQQGYGSALLSVTVNALRDIKCKEVLLSVHPENISAKKLFEKCGFRFHKHEAEYFGPKEPRDILQIDTSYNVEI